MGGRALREYLSGSWEGAGGEDVVEGGDGEGEEYGEYVLGFDFGFLARRRVGGGGGGQVFV